MLARIIVMFVLLFIVLNISNYSPAILVIASTSLRFHYRIMRMDFLIRLHGNAVIANTEYLGNPHGNPHANSCVTHNNILLFMKIPAVSVSNYLSVQ